MSSNLVISFFVSLISENKKPNYLNLSKVTGMAGNETVITQTLQFFTYPVALYFYSAIAGLLGFIGFEVFNRWMSRKETEDFHKSIVDVHRGKTLMKATRDEEEGESKEKPVNVTVNHNDDVNRKLDELIELMKKQQTGNQRT